MKFVCDSCQTQYNISDEKVGPHGVKVRCKRCKYEMVLQPAKQEDGQMNGSKEDFEGQGETNLDPLSASSDTGFPGTRPEIESTDAAVDSTSNVIDDELGRAFESVLAKGDQRFFEEDDEFEEGYKDGWEMNKQDSSALEDASVLSQNTGTDSYDSLNDPDHQPTKVVNLSGIANLFAKEEPKKKRDLEPSEPEDKNAHSNNSSNFSGDEKVAEAEWFVAIDDQQVGPWTLEQVGESWKRGELSADSLVWRAGMEDWASLSSIPELVNELVPLKSRVREEVFSSGEIDMRNIDVPTALPPPQEGQDSGAEELVWNSSAASVLDSLVQEELNTLSSSSSDSALSAKSPNPSESGLFDHVPQWEDQLSSQPEPEVSSLSIPNQKYIPGSEVVTSRGGEDSQAAESVDSPAFTGGYPESNPPAASQLTVTSAPNVAAPQVSTSVSAGPYPEPANVIPPKPMRIGLYITLGVLVGALLVSVVVGAVLYFALKPQLAGLQSKVPQTSSQVTATPAPKTTESRTEEGAAHTQAIKQETPQQKSPVQSEIDNSKQQEIAKTETKEQQVPPRRQPIDQESKRKKPVNKKIVAGNKKNLGKRSVKNRSPASSAPSRSKIDEDFDKIFGTSSGKTSSAKSKRGNPKTVYIPPAPGKGSLKEALGQGDIMEVVVTHKSLIRKCSKVAGEGGTIVMRWTILPNGMPTNVVTVTEKLKNSKLSACLTSTIKRLRFPAYSGSKMKPIDFPFKF